MNLENKTFKTSDQLKKSALQQLRGNWGKSIIITLICLIVLNSVSFFIDLKDVLNFFGLATGFVLNESSIVIKISNVISFIFSGALYLGSSFFFLNLIRGREPSVSNILYGFENFLKAFLLELFRVILVLLWSLLLIIPGIVAAFKYSMSYYILIDNPHLSSGEAIDLSCKMMYGHKLRLFKIYLSFIGWAILSVLTFGIGFIWLAPYCETTLANFYEDLKTSNVSNL